MSEDKPISSGRNWRRVVLWVLLPAVILAVIVLQLFTSNNPNWTGFYEYIKPNDWVPAKTLWDWLQLLIVPLIVAVAGVAINSTVQRAEQARRDQQARIERERAERQAQADRERAERQAQAEEERWYAGFFLSRKIHALRNLHATIVEAYQTLILYGNQPQVIETDEMYKELIVPIERKYLRTMVLADPFLTAGQRNL
jgi:type II secretory pathway pseudopilin PulG